MLPVLLLMWVTSSTASIQCPRHCSCPDYARAVCMGFLSKNFASFLDSRLKDLTLQGTNVTELACNTLPEGIEKLVLFRNWQLNTISFDCMNTLRHLEISGVGMSELYPITDQHIGSINSSDFPKLLNLQTVYLSRLQVSDSLGLLLQFFNTAKEIHLNYVNIKNLSSLDIETPSIKLLDLSNNPIRNISSSFFRSLKNLETLQLEWAKLSDLRGNIFHLLEHLTFLRLDGNNLTSFKDETFLGLPNLNKLRLSKNQVKFFQGALTRNLGKLEELYLNDNELTKLKSDVFSSLIDLKVLNLTQNMLETIPKDVFINQQQLQKLYLGWNRLERLEADTFYPLRKLHTLYLERNRLMFLEQGTFQNLVSLRVLKLSSNFLKKISGVLFPREAVLQKLYLEYNSIESIDPMTFRPLGNLEKLRLDGNNFVNISMETFEYLNNLKYLNMSECNTLECNCALEKLWKHCQLRNIAIDNGTVCYENSSSVHWTQLKICPLEESETQYVIIIIISCVLVLLLISFQAVRYFLQRARSATSAWPPPQSITTESSTNCQHPQVPEEENYDFVSAEDKISFSKFTLGQQEDYIEPTAPKLVLPICKPMENPRKVKRRKPSVSFQPVLSSQAITVPKFKAPAVPPED